MQYDGQRVDAVADSTLLAASAGCRYIQGRAPIGGGGPAAGTSVHTKQAMKNDSPARRKATEATPEQPGRSVHGGDNGGMETQNSRRERYAHAWWWCTQAPRTCEMLALSAEQLDRMAMIRICDRSEGASDETVDVQRRRRMSFYQCAEPRGRSWRGSEGEVGDGDRRVDVRRTPAKVFGMHHSARVGTGGGGGPNALGARGPNTGSAGDEEV
ncbi:hypothetical protein B0H13DRAFT_1908679 [Mycena leptocephala]|nr:hypothetical protein B0H13DRAFT_1908679 [Mycena leptocephala]